MKKVLSFVLVLAMILGSVSMAFAFTDDASITNTEAAKVLNAAGILEGYTDGSFKPEGILTRAEGAAIVARMLLGKSDAAKLSTVVNPFNDVNASDWCAGYIAYCVSQGIINGYGDGNFGPNDTLSVAAFGKMMLTALGYKSENEGFVGAAWESNVGSVMVKAGLTDGVTTTNAAGCSRQVAAQVALNTLKADLVKYDGTATTVSAGDVTITTGKSAAKKQNWTDDPQGGDTNNYNNNAWGTQPIKFMSRYQSKLQYDEAADDFGRPTGYTWSYDNKKAYDGFKTGDLKATFTGTQTKGTMYDVLGSSVYNKHTEDQASTTGALITDGFKYIVDGTASGTATFGAFFVKNSKDDTQYAAGNGTTTEVYVDSDYNVTIVVINKYLGQATKDYDAKNNRLAFTSEKNANASLKYVDGEDFDVTGYKNEDYFLFTAANNGGTWSIKSVEPAAKITGTVSTYTSGKNVTIDGTQYKYSKMTWSTGAALGTSGVNSEVTVITDGKNLIMNYDDTKVIDDYVFLTQGFYANNSTSSKVQAEAYFIDGTKATITVGKLNGTTVKANGTVTAKAIDEGWYGYSIKDGEYRLYNNDGKVVVGIADTTTGAVTKNGKITIANGGYSATNATKFVVLDKNDNLKVYDGYKAVPTIDGKATTLNAYVVKTGATSTYAKYVFVALAGNASMSGSTKDYYVVYKAENPGVIYNENGDGHRDYTKVLINGEAGTLSATTTSFGAIGAYVNDQTDSDGFVSKVVSMTAYTTTSDDYRYWTVASGAAVTQNNGVFTANNTSIGTADGCKVVYINGNDYADGYTLASLVNTLGKVGASGGADYVFVKMDDKNENAVAIYYFSNRAD